ncbi:hypothetical protein [Streptomyces collinus]|uniref:hypothetical protein n=1 Tax=Streptomyces collinus TaxID=42684 RepID=UPI00343FD73A
MAGLLSLLQERDPAGRRGADIAAAGAAALGVDGVTVSLTSGPDRGETQWASDGASRGFEDLQATLGEGPGVDCLAVGTTVRVPDLARVRRDRWPALITEVPDQAARAVFCFPARESARSSWASSPSYGVRPAN